MDVLRLAGDALWIISLSIMTSASRAAWKRIEPGTMVPLQFANDGRPTRRTKRGLALSLIPGAAFVVGILLVASNRRTAGWGDEALVLFGVRATAAALFAVAHLRWLSAALAALDREGALKP
ncbi:hypothetical protein [Phenylobacterium sp.]|jgi:hypothetical protein|uniref:hypothetical protein n=1 Tax=Phenylobacterium sp. TaxID=1871053 RepID=UPI002F411F97